MFAPKVVFAQDALRGKRYYLDGGRMNGSGLSCVDCHGGFPGALHGIGKAARNPSAIDYALGTVSQMTPLRGRLGAGDIADLAAYLGDPGVGSPDLRLFARTPTGVKPVDRLELSAAPGGTAEAELILTNAGAAPLQLLSPPALSGPDGGLFFVTGSDCLEGRQLAPGQSCGIRLRFQPGPRRLRPATLHTATLSLRHDWVNGGVFVALIGRGLPLQKAGRTAGV